MISENDSRPTYDLNNTASVVVQQQTANQANQKQAQNTQVQNSQTTTGQANQPGASITNQFYSLPNYSNQQMDLNQYLEAQMAQLNQIIFILKQLQVNHIEPMKNTSNHHQLVIDQLQSHQQQFEQFMKQQLQINQQYSLQLQQQNQQLSQIQNAIQQLQAHHQTNHPIQSAHQAPQTHPQYMPASQPQSQNPQQPPPPQQQVIQIQPSQPQNAQSQQQSVTNQSQQQHQQQQSQPQQQTPHQVQLQPNQQVIYPHVDPQQNFTNQNLLQYIQLSQLPQQVQSQLIYSLANSPQIKHQANQLLANYFLQQMVHEDGDNNNAHANYLNLAHQTSELFQKFNIGSNPSQTQTRPIPPTSPNQQTQEVILNETNLHQIDALAGQQSAQARPISLGSSVLVQGASAQSTSNSSNTVTGQTSNTQACSQILNHSNNQPRILNLPQQVVVPEQVLKQNNSGSTLSTNSANGGQTQQGLIPNLQQPQTQQQNNIPNSAAN